MNKPLQKGLANVDWSGVVAQAREHVNGIDAGTTSDDNDDLEYLFEEVMKALYGDDYFTWENSKT